MKNLKTVITIIAISLATTFSTVAGDKKSSKIKKELRTEIVSMIGDEINIEFNKTCSAEISFMINNKNELIVVSVDCASKEFNSYVKRKLNYKKINVKGTKKGEIYRVPVTLKVK